MPWLLTVVLLLFVSATSALAQWQTNVDVIVYTLTDPSYLAELQTQKSAAQKRGDHVGVAKMDFLLSRKSNPVGYEVFTSTLKEKIDAWVKKEVQKGQESPICGQTIGVLLAPYAMVPSPGDVQVTIVWRDLGGDKTLAVTRTASLLIRDSVEKSLEFLKLIILAPVTPSITPTSTKRSA